MNKYDKQAQKFLTDTETTLSVEYSHTGKHFADDTDKRDIFQFTFKNKRGEYSSTLGDSLHNTETRSLIRRGYLNQRTLRPSEIATLRRSGLLAGKEVSMSKVKNWMTENKLPSAYSILACLEKYNPCQFDNFCDDYGYDNDSMKAFKVYQAVCEQYNGLACIFTPDEMEQMAEIQ